MKNLKKFYNFRTEIKNRYEYHTEKTIKNIPLPGLLFYIKLFSIICHTALLVKLKKFDDLTWAISSDKIRRAVESVGGKFNITGLEYIYTPYKPVIFMANHMSNLENMILPELVLGFRNVTFVVKNELLHYPIFGTIMKATSPVPLQRKNPKEDLQKMMNDCSQKLKNKTSVIVFPQHTRRPNILPEQFNSIAVKIAAANDVPIVPVAVKTDFWGLGKKIKDFGPINPNKTIYIEFGRPIKLPTNSTVGDQKLAHKQAVEFIISCHKKWAAEK